MEGYKAFQKNNSHLISSSFLSTEYREMASTVGVPSLYQVPHLEFSKTTSKKRSTCLPLSLNKPFLSPFSLRRPRLIHTSSSSSLLRLSPTTVSSHLSNYDFRYSLIDIPLISIIRSAIILCKYPTS